MSALAQTKRAQARALRAQADALDGEAAAIEQSTATSGVLDELVSLDSTGAERRAIDRAIRDQKLPAARVGRRVMVRRSDLLRFFDSLVVEQRAERKPTAEASTYGSIVEIERRRKGAA